MTMSTTAYTNGSSMSSQSLFTTAIMETTDMSKSNAMLAHNHCMIATAETTAMRRSHAISQRNIRVGKRNRALAIKNKCSAGKPNQFAGSNMTATNHKHVVQIVSTLQLTRLQDSASDAAAAQVKRKKRKFWTKRR